MISSAEYSRHGRNLQGHRENQLWKKFRPTNRVNTIEVLDYVLHDRIVLAEAVEIRQILFHFD